MLNNSAEIVELVGQILSEDAARVGGNASSNIEPRKPESDATASIVSMTQNGNKLLIATADGNFWMLSVEHNGTWGRR